MATIIKIKASDLKKVSSKKLPKSWLKAEGLLKYKAKAIEQEYKRIRAEWR